MQLAQLGQAAELTAYVLALEVGTEAAQVGITAPHLQRKWR